MNRFVDYTNSPLCEERDAKIKTDITTYLTSYYEKLISELPKEQEQQASTQTLAPVIKKSCNIIFGTMPTSISRLSTGSSPAQQCCGVKQRDTKKRPIIKYVPTISDVIDRTCECKRSIVANPLLDPSKMDDDSLECRTHILIQRLDDVIKDNRIIVAITKDLVKCTKLANHKAPLIDAITRLVNRYYSSKQKYYPEYDIMSVIKYRNIQYTVNAKKLEDFNYIEPLVTSQYWRYRMEVIGNKPIPITVTSANTRNTIINVRLKTIINNIYHITNDNDMTDTITRIYENMTVEKDRQRLFAYLSTISSEVRDTESKIIKPTDTNITTSKPILEKIIKDSQAAYNEHRQKFINALPKILIPFKKFDRIIPENIVIPVMPDTVTFKINTYDILKLFKAKI